MKISQRNKMGMLDITKRYKIMDCGGYVSGLDGTPITGLQGFCFSRFMEGFYRKSKIKSCQTNAGGLVDTYRLNGIKVVVERKGDGTSGFLTLSGSRFEVKNVLTRIIDETKFKLKVA